MKKPSGQRAWKALLLSCPFSAKCLSKGIGLLKSQLFYLQEFEPMEHFKLELIEYLACYNNRRIKAEPEGLLPAIHRQQALMVA